MQAVPDRFIRWFLYLLYGLLGVFAVFAAFERMNSDAGYYLFHAINTRNFYVEHGRFVLALAELPPLLFTWLGLPLAWVVTIYSLGHVGLFALIAWYCRRIADNWNATLAVSLCAFMGLRESVFTPQFELYYGLALLVLAFCLYRKFSDGWNTRALLFLFLLLVLVITSHPMALLCTLGLFLLGAAERRQFRRKDFGWLLALLVLYSLWKKYQVSGYESGKFDMYWNALKDGKFTTVFTHGNFGKQCLLLLEYYPDVLLLFFFGIFTWIRQRKALVASVYMDLVFGFLLLTWMLYPDSTHVFRYLEQVYFPFVFAVVCFVLLQNRITYALLGIAVFSLFFRVVVVQRSYKKFQERTGMMDYFIHRAAKMQGQRFYVIPDDMGPEQYDLADWSYGFESMVRSEILVGKTIAIVTQDDLFFEKNDSLLRSDEYLFRRWEREKTSTLNSRYFQLDSGRYRYLFSDKIRGISR